MSGQDSGNNVGKVVDGNSDEVVDGGQRFIQDDSAVLAIGLGGTGVDCLRTLKKRVYERLQSDNPGEVVPSYEHIKFLAVDSDADGMGKAADSSVYAPYKLNMDTEFFDVSCADNLSEIFGKNRVNLAKDPAYREWLQFDDINKVGTATDGAGGVRQIGRYLLVRRASEFVSTVRDMVTEAMEDANGNKRKVYVHVFSGLSGGTGSGTFLDACYLVREALRRAGANGNSVMGYLFLPDVNLADKAIPTNVRTYIEHNGYAAMQELDYCMGFGRNGDVWHQTYPRVGDVRWETPPVDLCHLVAGKTSKGVPLPKMYKHAMSVVADYVMDFLAKPAQVAFSLKSHLSNVQTIRDAERNEQDAGACYDYLVLGASCAVVPYGRIMTYLVSGFFQRLEGLGMRGRVPTQQEVERFQEGVGLTHDALLRELQRGVGVDPDYYGARPADAQKKSPNVEDHYMKLEAAAKGALAQNLSDLSRDVPGHVRSGLPTDGRAQAVMAKVVNAVLDAMVDPERGPWYASALLRSAKVTDLLAAARGIEAKAERERVQEEAQDEEGMPILDDFVRARDEFFNCSFRLKKRYDAFVEKTCELTRCRIRRDSYEALENLAGSLAAQIKRLADELTGPFEDAMGELIDIFDESWSYLKHFADGASTYEQPVVTMSQIAPVLDGELESCDVGKVTQELLDTLLDKRGRAALGPGGDRSILIYRVSDYFAETFKDWSQRSLTKYLEDKYGIHNNPKLLAKQVQDDLLKNMDKRAEVLFDTDGRYDLPDDGSALCYVTVPQTSPVVVNAADGFVKARGTGFKKRETSAADRVSFLRLKIGVPLWGYGALARCEAGYQPAPGRHLYERAVYVDGVSDSAEVEASRDWGNLPSPVPLSLSNSDIWVEKLNEALAADVIVPHKKGYYIRTLTDEFMGGIRTKHDAAKGLPIVDRLKVQNELQAMDSNRVYDPNVHLLSDMMRPQNIKAERTICADLLAKAPVLVEIVREELEKCREIAGYIEDLQPKVDHDLESFRNALFTGVIEFSNPVVQYVSGGLNGPIVLSDRTFGHGTIPLYQALLSFKDKSVLVPAMRKAIEAQTQSILTANQIPASVQGACDAVQRELDRGPNLIAIATAMFPREVGEVTNLLTDLTKQLTTFRLAYLIPGAKPNTN
ncbi:hypothetical protein ADJ70_11275 [Olsenella sp. oral taxon 807]|uniref:tubulin-like doman-containing protein n=1 Tax=Olsenella sp. oral taxon 807 TaxID=712411 RepID=UPI00067A181C|nr:tubulin-like doman-containing protein [Olsenella sp. oral taxon 807]AKT49397.1 hypothetical protein ADJ70_11275 [Olsenella sp. oral taxon 807]